MHTYKLSSTSVCLFVHMEIEYLNLNALKASELEEESFNEHLVATVISSNDRKKEP